MIPEGIAIKNKNMFLQFKTYLAIGTRIISKAAQLNNKRVVPLCLNYSPLYSLTIIRFKLLQGTNPNPRKEM